MKFRLLFWMRGNGRAGSRPSGLKTGSTSLAKYFSSQRRVLGVQAERDCRLTPACDELRQQDLVEAAVLLGAQVLRAGVDAIQLLRNRHRIGGLLGLAQFLQVLQARDPDLEELIEVAGGDAQELQPLEQRLGVIEGQRQHPVIELQEGEFTVDVAARRLEVRDVHAITIHKRPCGLKKLRP